MSDEFAICPCCGEIEPGWDNVRPDGSVIRCNSCHVTYPYCELLWKFYDIQDPELFDFDSDATVTGHILPLKF